MTCHPERVTALVDDVLEPPARGEIETHIRSCPACAEQAAQERELRARLRALPAVPTPPGLESDVRRRLRRGRRRAWRFVLPVAASLVALLLWARGAAPFVAWELARDHTHCFAKKMLPAQLWTRDIEEVKAWFESQGTPVPPLPASASGLEPVGARYCPLVDRFVAHVYYAGGERRVSVFLVPGSVRFQTSYAASVGGRSVHLMRVGETTVGVAGERAEDVEAFRRSLTTAVAWNLRHPVDR